MNEISLAVIGSDTGPDFDEFFDMHRDRLHQALWLLTRDSPRSGGDRTRRVREGPGALGQDGRCRRSSRVSVSGRHECLAEPPPCRRRQRSASCASNRAGTTWPWWIRPTRSFAPLPPCRRCSVQRSGWWKCSISPPNKQVRHWAYGRRPCVCISPELVRRSAISYRREPDEERSAAQAQPGSSHAHIHLRCGSSSGGSAGHSSTGGHGCSGLEHRSAGNGGLGRCVRRFRCRLSRRPEWTASSANTGCLSHRRFNGIQGRTA